MGYNFDMTDIGEFIETGENIHIEFKSDEVRPESLAREMAAFSNTFGGTILIGIQDDKVITGINDDKKWLEWVSNISRNAILPGIHPEISLVSYADKIICRIDVPKGKDKPYQTTHDGKYWLRISSTVRQATKEELSRLFQAAGLFHYDISPVLLSHPEALNQKKLHDYFKNIYNLDFEKMETDEKLKILLNAGLLTDQTEGLHPTVGGILLFSDNSEKYLPQAVLSVAVINGATITDEIIQKKEISGTLVDQVENALSFLNIFIPEPLILDGSAQRKNTIAIPRNVLREALVNAVCHRDYSISTRKIQIFIFRDRIEIRNPGRLANTLTLEKIRYGNSAPRNLLLLKFLDNMHYIDGLGRGVPLIIRQMEERTPPGVALFAEDGDIFTLTLKFNV